MTDTENIRIQYPDKFGIKEKLRNNLEHNPEFLELTLKSHELLSLLQNQKLAITESLRVNKNVSIFEHQIRAAQRVKNDLGGSALLSDEVGLGKTVEAGIIIKEFLMTSLAKKVLILAPPSLLLQWQDEMISKFNLDFVSQKGDSRFTSVSSHNLLLMSHSSAVFPNYSEALKNIFWDIIVVDEAHSMKNSQTHKHKLVQNLSKRHLLLLSATPVQNNLSELYNIVELLRPGYLGTWNQFKEKYTLDDSSRRLNSLYREELQEILSKVVVRTTRKEVGQYIDFKERIPHTNILEPTEKESLLYRQITDCIREAYDASEDSNFLALMTYQRLAASSTRCSKRALYKMKMNKVIDGQKYDSLISIADQIPIDSKLLDLMKIISSDKSKFLIFTEFYATQDYVVEYLKEHGYSVAVFNGKLSVDERSESVRNFKNKCQIMVSTGAGGEGQNFQFCHNVVNYDLPWNPMKVEQKIGRVHRIGQTSDVNIYNYAIHGTIEAYILELLYEKIQLFTMVLGEMDLIFEDSEDNSSQTWFKEFMDSKSESEIKNKFSSLGDSLKNQKEVAEVVKNFSSDVFQNFNLSAIKGEDDNGA